MANSDKEQPGDGSFDLFSVMPSERFSASFRKGRVYFNDMLAEQKPLALLGLFVRGDDATHMRLMEDTHHSGLRRKFYEEKSVFEGEHHFTVDADNIAEFANKLLAKAAFEKDPLVLIAMMRLLEKKIDAYDRQNDGRKIGGISEKSYSVFQRLLEPNVAPHTVPAHTLRYFQQVGLKLMGIDEKLLRPAMFDQAVANVIDYILLHGGPGIIKSELSFIKSATQTLTRHAHTNMSLINRHYVRLQLNLASLKQFAGRSPFRDELTKLKTDALEELSGVFGCSRDHVVVAANGITIPTIHEMFSGNNLALLTAIKTVPDSVEASQLAPILAYMQDPENKPTRSWRQQRLNLPREQPKND